MKSNKSSDKSRLTDFRGYLSATIALTPLTIALTPLLLVAGPAFAQAEQARSPEPQVETVVVTARRQNETLLSTPVAVAVVGSDKIDRLAITTMDDISKIVPTLVITPQDDNQAGGAINIRGISGVSENPFSDQAVAFNIDGVQVARSTVKRLGDFDLTNIQVLEGPQALYFGKNSPGGIIVINTNNPTPDFEEGVTLSYEAIGDEKREEGYVSGPVTDTLGFRIAAYGDQLGGWVKNIATPDPLYGPASSSLPRSNEYGGRLTLTYQPSEDFNASFKFTADNRNDLGLYENAQIVACPLGSSQLGVNSTCRPGDTSSMMSYGPEFYRLYGSPWSPDGSPHMNVTQYLSALQMNWNLPDSLVLSSLTTYYQESMLWTGTDNQVNPATNGGANLAVLQAALEAVDVQEETQEFRLTSNFTGPLNFMLGAYIQHSELRSKILGFLVADPTVSNFPVNFHQSGLAPSVFGDLTYKPIEQLEISAGARLSYEQKSINCFTPAGTYTDPYGAFGFGPNGGLCLPFLKDGTASPNGSWRNVSPQVTVTWRPTDALTVYGSYKVGYLSGGFAVIGFPAFPGQSLAYKPETVRGWEGGVKTVLDDGNLQLLSDAWYYNISGQQVPGVVGNTVTIDNAGSSITRGAEANLDWTSPIAGLEFNSGVSYTNAYYVKFLGAVCWQGQTPLEGCNGNSQNLSGAPLPQVATWVETMGASYSKMDEGGDRYTLSFDGFHSSHLLANLSNNPYAVQPGYWLLDAAVRVELPSGIELAVIGKNLSDTYYFEDSASPVGTGGGTGTPGGVPGDLAAGVSQGREVIFKVSARFN